MMLEMTLIQITMSTEREMIGSYKGSHATEFKNSAESHDEQSGD